MARATDEGEPQARNATSGDSGDDVPPEPLPEAPTEPPAETETPEPPPAEPIDLMKGINFKKHVKTGTWTRNRRGGDRVISPVRGDGVLQLPEQPPEEYTLSMRVKRITGNNTFGDLIQGGDTVIRVAIEGQETATNEAADAIPILRK